MPQMRCKCGHLLMLGEIPCPIEYALVHSSRFEEMYSMTSVPDALGAIENRQGSVYRCPVCARLAVFWEQDADAEWYRPEPQRGHE